jgi:hypothetical protein
MLYWRVWYPQVLDNVTLSPLRSSLRLRSGQALSEPEQSEGESKDLTLFIQVVIYLTNSSLGLTA